MTTEEKKCICYESVARVVARNPKCPVNHIATPPETGREWEKVMEQLRKFFFMCGVMRVEPTLEEFTKIISPLLLSEHQRWVDKEIEYLDKNAVATDGDTLFVKIRKSSMKDAFSLIAGEKEGV